MNQQCCLVNGELTLLEEFELVLGDAVEGKQVRVVELGRERVAHELRLDVVLVFVEAVLYANSPREARLVDVRFEQLDLHLVRLFQQLARIIHKLFLTARLSFETRNHPHVQTPLFRSLQSM